MESFFVPMMLVVTAFAGFALGADYGRQEGKVAVAECEKELPRNVHCRIIAVPVDKN